MSDPKITLDALRSTLGIKQFPTYEFECYGHKWAVRHLLPEEVEFAWLMVEKTGAAEKQAPMTLSIALLACGVCFIDETPTYQLFDFEVKDTVTDPAIPPINVRREAMAALFNFLRQEVPNKVVMEIFKKFREHVNPLQEVISVPDPEAPDAPEEDAEEPKGDSDPLA
jgi:hypothetical protein